MKTLRAAFHWFCTTPASLAAAFMVLGIFLGGSIASYSRKECTPEPLQTRMVDCDLGDWLERWQTILGSLIAVIAAGTVSYPVFKQLGESRRQAAAAAAATLREVIDPLERELAVFEAARPEIRLMGLTMSRLSARPGSRYGLPPQRELEDTAEAIGSLRKHLGQGVLRNPRPGLLADARSVFSRRTENLEYMVFTSLDVVISSEIESDGETKTDEAELAAAVLDELQTGYREWTEAAKIYVGELRSEVTQLWVRTRELEELAAASDRDIVADP